MRKSTICILLLILAAGFIIRVLGAGEDFFDDEADWIVLVHSVSFSKESLNLPLTGIDHGPLPVYLIKASSVLFGESRVGYRLIGILLSTALIWLVFILTKDGLGEREGIFAALLVSLNSMLIYYSREIGCEPYNLFFTLLAIYFFFQTTKTKKNHYFIFFGINMGFALLARLTTLFLVPAFALYLLINKENRIFFRRPSLYLSILICATITYPYLYWLSQHEWIHLVDNVGSYIKFFKLSLTIPSMFLGSLLSKNELIAPFPVLYSFGREHMSLAMGLVFVAGIIFTIKRAKTNKIIQLMQIIIWSAFLISILFFYGYGRHFLIMVIPAAILASAFINSVWNGGRLGRILIVIFFILQILFIPKDLSEIHNMYNRNSLITLASWGKPDTEVNLNIISSSFIPLIKKYGPNLVVMPNPAWDTIACYINAQTKIKTFCPLLGFDAIRFLLSDWKKVMIIDDHASDLLVYRNWAEHCTFYNIQLVEDNIEIETEKARIKLPVAALILSVDNGNPFSRDKAGETESDNFIARSFKEKYMIPVPF